jgi:hypothetical protein
MVDDETKIVKSRGRHGGRQKGTPNKKTAAQVAAVRETGITPLEFMLRQMRAPAPRRATVAQKLEHAAQRMEAAKAAAPYVHAKLSAVQVSGGLKLNHESALDELE